MINMINALGNTSATQLSLKAKIDQKRIENFLLKNLDKIKSSYLMKDSYFVELFNCLEKNKKLNFQINKHEEIFILRRNNLQEILKYILFRYKFRISGKNKINSDFPQYILIELVSACNFTCVFCFQSDKSFRKKPFVGVMKMELLKKVVDEADELGIGAVTFASRGEPTLHKNFCEIIQYTASKPNIFEVKVNSNGSFLTEKIAHAVFKNNVTQFVISADHYIKEEYEKLRVGGNFEKVIKNLSMFKNIRDKYYKNCNTEIRVSGIDATKKIDKDKFANFWSDKCDHVTIGDPFEMSSTYENTPKPELVQPCEFLWDRMYVWYDGKANPCDLDYKSKLTFGNLNQDSIQKVWNSQIINNLRKMHLNNNRNKLIPCDRCGAEFD